MRYLPISAYQFPLSSELIAKYPAPKRRESRLLSVLDKQCIHEYFYDVLSRINPNDLLVFNDTKVIPARIFAHKNTGGRIEILVERMLTTTVFTAQIRASKPLHDHQEIMINQIPMLRVLSRLNNGFYECQVISHQAITQFLDEYGEIPLPPYIERSVEDLDRERYQTVYAKKEGSVAAPTAGLHFDQELLNQLRIQGVAFGFVTLHIGAGTFAPVRVDNITNHQMHSEFMIVTNELCQKIQNTKARGGRIIAVGTTALRALETASQTGRLQPYVGETEIFIYPGFQFHCVDVLITNFHLPGSTLIMLVCALGGYQRVMQAYQTAIKEGYHFFSYGDAMWLPRYETDL